MKRHGFIVFLGIFVILLSLEAVTPRKWEVRSKEDFLKGKLDGVSVSFEGLLTLAPREDKLEGPSEDFYLSFLVAQDGTTYLGTGHGGKIYRLSKDGKADIYFQAQEMDVTCLAQDGNGALFAGTSPNGKIYKITGKDKQEVFFNPGEKYIWDLAFADDGFLLAAVGEGGGIYKINSKGEGQLLLKSEENHVLCLKRDEKGDLYAGSGGTGVVYRIGAEGRAAVLFESPYEEIKSIALDKEGNLYIAAGGTPSRAKKEEAAEVTAKIATEVTVTAIAGAPSAGGPFPAVQREPGALFKLGPDGIAKRLWESSEELIYSLLWDEKERTVTFGTGNKGRIYRIDKNEKVSVLLQGSSEQVYALSPSGEKTYALANNPTRLSVLSPEQRFNGEYVSDVLDTRTVSSWGKLEFEADIPAGTTLQLQTRSGNSFEPNSMWSDWSPPYQKKEEQILSPKSRYLQLKVMFKTTSGKASPVLQRVALFYLQANVAPIIQRLELLPPNEVYLKPPEQEDIIWGVLGSRSDKAEKKDELKSLLLAKKVERKGYQTIIWEAGDENEDDLLFTLSIRKEGESAWRLLREGWSDSLFAFDTLSFPDGVYYLKLEASDLASNPPGMEKKTDKISQPLTIDNSLPVIKNLTALRNNNVLEVAFAVEDSFSSIEKAEYLVRPGEWRSVFPVDGICDSKQESFKFSLSLPSNADSLITIRVTDRHHNIGVLRQTF